MREERLNRLDSLRGLAFLSVFISHAGALWIECLGLCGVSIFFVLSGFLMTYNYYGHDKLKICSINNNLIFSINKIKYLYSLHIITMLSFLVLIIVGDSTERLSVIIVKILMNVFMIQEWFPVYHVSINGVAWYMCAIVFAYFMFPYINRCMEKKYNKRKAFTMIFVAIIIQCIIGLIGTKLQNINVVNGSLLKRNLMAWFVYYFPLSRLVDFFIGCNLAYIYKHKTHDLSKTKYTLLELFSIMLVIISTICSQMFTFDVWYTHVLIFTVSTIILVYLFAVGKGVISNVLTNKVTLYLAKISQFAFLIHYVVLRYLYTIIYHLPNCKEFAIKYCVWINLTIGFILTVVLCEMWKILSNKIRVIK